MAEPNPNATFSAGDVRAAFHEGRQSMHGTDRHYGDRAWDNSHAKAMIEEARTGVHKMTIGEAHAAMLERGPESAPPRDNEAEEAAEI